MLPAHHTHWIGDRVDDFAEFYLASRDGVFRAVLAAGGRRAVAEEAVAEAYARACARWQTLREHPRPMAWVMRTALNVQRSWWRRRWREVLGPVPERAGRVADLPEPGLRAQVAALPRRQREVVALRLLADLSAEETADVLGIAPSTVHVHLHRAIGTLRARLGTDRSTASTLTNLGLEARQ